MIWYNMENYISIEPCVVWSLEPNVAYWQYFASSTEEDTVTFWIIIMPWVVPLVIDALTISRINVVIIKYGIQNVNNYLP